MKGLHDSPIGDFTRGGQTTLMMIRMIGEVFSRFGGAMLIVYTAATIALFMHRSEPYQRYLLMRYAGSAIAVTLMGNGDKPTLIQNPDGSMQTVTFRAVYNAPIMKSNLHSALYLWLWNMLASMMGCLMVLAMVFGAMIRFGKRLTKEEHIRGARLVDSVAATRYLKENKVASDLRIAGVPLYAGKETSHVILTGAPGTGKSTTLYELMTRIRSRGDRCICFSPSGEFIEWFYRAEKDVILNPFDRRCPYWSLWDEITKVTDPDMLAAAWVPIPAEGDKFWAEAGQSLISDLIGKTRERSDHDYRTFMKLLSTEPLEVLSTYIQGTSAAVSMDPKVEKMALSIKTTAMRTLRILHYLRPAERRFIIRDWVRNENSDQWLFLTSPPDQMKTARPLLSCWLELLTKNILSLPPRLDRRIWIIVDELPALQKQEALQELLAQGRKYGACCVLSFQNMPQIREIYGRDGAAALIGLASTWVCLRQNDPETAKWISDAFGEEEVNENNEGLSYGSHEMRDGVSLSHQKKTRPVLLPSQILGVADLEGYIKMPKPAPSVHFVLDHLRVKPRAAAFEPADISIAAIPGEYPATPPAVTQKTTTAPAPDGAGGRQPTPAKTPAVRPATATAHGSDDYAHADAGAIGAEADRAVHSRN